MPESVVATTSAVLGEPTPAEQRIGPTSSRSSASRPVASPTGYERDVAAFRQCASAPGEPR
ncbi:hypothetical protein [Streptomyces sp. NPDC060035]|uniref:hypothetical protein n=1 Tax=Streptomyces sp. NPDC060035 TaxID=3347044 RepID=UPI00369C5049